MAIKITGKPAFIEKTKKTIAHEASTFIDVNIVEHSLDTIDIHVNEQTIEYYQSISKQLFDFSTTLIGKSHRGQVSISANDVVLIEAFGNSVETIVDKKVIVLEKKLYELEEELSKDGFIRIGKSTLINSNKIDSVASAYNGKLLLYVENDQKVYVNRSYSKSFKEMLKKKRGV